MAQVDVVRATATPGGLLERADELSALDDRLDAVEESGCGHVVLLRGEAGVGKTALIREFCERRRGSVTIAGGACEPLFAPRPRGRFLEIAQTLKGDLLPLVEQGAMPYQVVVALAEELRRQAPTVLLLEDVHWADEATLDVLRLLARRIESVPALVVASYRDDELDVRDPLRIVIGELATSPSISRMKLSGLSPGAVAVSTPTCGSRWMSPSSATKSSAPLVRACSACATDTSDPARSPSRPCSYASRGRARAASPSALAAAHVFPAQTWELESTEAIKRAAREGLGIAFLSRYAVAEEIERGELTSCRIAGRPPMERTLDVARLARRPFTPSERGFLDTLRSC